MRLMRTGVAAAAAAVLAAACGAGAQDDGAAGEAVEAAAATYDAPYQIEARAILAASVGYHTAIGHGQVPAYAEYLAGLLRDGGFPAEDVHVEPFTTAAGDETALLIARYRGDGSSGAKPIALMAHMDVVEALPEDWERDPFTLVEEDGFFFGRGVFDNKLGVTTLVSTLLRLKAEGFTPTRDLILTLSGDEETAMESTRALVTTYRELTDAEYALNSDAGGGSLNVDGAPVSLAFQAAEKTYATFELTVRNPGGHSSTPRADNAIYELADALKRLEAHRFAPMINDISAAFLHAQAAAKGGELGAAMQAFVDDPNDAAAGDALYREPSYVGVTRTTCVATMLRGGHAENALPQSATATVNCRIFPGVSIEEVQAELQETVANPALEITVIGDPTSAPASPLNADVLAAVERAVRGLHPGVVVIPYMAPYATDGKEFRAAGVPTYGVSGLFIREEDEFAHGLNERIPVDGFYEELEYWHALLTDLAG